MDNVFVVQPRAVGQDGIESSDGRGHRKNNTAVGYTSGVSLVCLFSRPIARNFQYLVWKQSGIQRWFYFFE